MRSIATSAERGAHSSATSARRASGRHERRLDRARGSVRCAPATRHHGDDGTVARLSGSPRAASRYRWASTTTVYSDHLETMLVRVETRRRRGWGKRRRPSLPRSAHDHRRLLGRSPWGGALRRSVYGTACIQRCACAVIRGLPVDAIAAIDIAVGHCGKIARQPSRVSSEDRVTIRPLLVSGLMRRLTPASPRPCDSARGAARSSCSERHRSRLPRYGPSRARRTRREVGLAVDALWRWTKLAPYASRTRWPQYNVLWLERRSLPRTSGSRAARSPMSSTIARASATARASRSAIFERGAVGVLQPDLGRSGITEAEAGRPADTHHVPVAPHVSIGLGPQIAAATHLAAAIAEPFAARVQSERLRTVGTTGARCAGLEVASVRVPQEPGLASRSTKRRFASSHRPGSAVVAVDAQLSRDQHGEFRGHLPDCQHDLPRDGSLDLDSRAIDPVSDGSGAHGLVCSAGERRLHALNGRTGSADALIVPSRAVSPSSLVLDIPGRMSLLR